MKKFIKEVLTSSFTVEICALMIYYILFAHIFLNHDGEEIFNLFTKTLIITTVIFYCISMIFLKQSRFSSILAKKRLGLIEAFYMMLEVVSYMLITTNNFNIEIIKPDRNILILFAYGVIHLIVNLVIFIKIKYNGIILQSIYLFLVRLIYIYYMIMYNRIHIN